MPLTTTPTTYGRPAAVELHARIRAVKDGDPLSPVTVVVPTNYAGASIRRLLGSGELGPLAPNTRGVVGLQFTTVSRLAETLGASSLTAAGRRPAATPVVAATIRGVLDDAPGIFAPVAGHSATVDALVQAHRELNALRPAQLDALAGCGPRPADVVRIHRATRARLVTDFYEVADLLAHAIAAVPGSPAIADLGGVIAYLPQRLSELEAHLLTAIGTRTDLHLIVGRTCAADADAEVLWTEPLLGASTAHAEVAMPQATTVIDTSDAEEECRSAVQVVQAALRDDDGSPTASERIAILYPSATPYARTLRAELDAAGIAWNGQRVDPVVESMLGRWVLALLRLDQRGWRRADVLRLLAEAPMLHQTSDGPRRVPVGAWERMTREAGITAGAATWQTALATVIVGHETSAEAERREVEPRTWLVDRHLRHAADATALQDFVTALIDGHQQHLGDATTWTQLAEGLRHLLTTQLDRDWDRWPPEARAAAERVELAIRRLTVLDDAPSATAPTPAMAAQIMEGELTDDLGRHGTFGHGVLVGPLSLGVGLDLDVVVVIGMAEGVTPAPTADDPLLHDDERAVLDGALPLRRDRSAQQHRQVIAALASGQRERVVIWSRGDLRRSAQREPSRWLAAFDARGAEHVASFAQRIAQTPIPATPATYRLAALRRGDPDLLDQHPVVADDQVLQRAVAAVTARRGPAFTRFDGNLTHAAHLIRRLDEASTSASRLETWAGCPHQYLVRYVLRVEPLEVPEARLDISALDKGSLIHDVLEAWIQEQLDADAVPDPDQPWNAVQRQRLLQLAADAGEQYVARGLTGHPTLWAYTRDRTLRDLARLLDEDDAHRQATGTRPVAVELAFGGEGEHVPPPIVLADGTALRLRGRIDRVDRDAAGVLQVVDYKTGSAMRANELDDPVRAGRSLQLSLYARALAGWEGSDGQELRATYWYISAKGGFARVGVVVDDAVIARQEEVLDTIVGGIHGGIFVANPDRSTTPWVTCAYCDPDGLGTAELGARFERLGRTAPELHAYVGMVEPDLLGPGQALDEGSTS